MYKTNIKAKLKINDNEYEYIEELKVVSSNYKLIYKNRYEKPIFLDGELGEFPLKKEIRKIKRKINPLIKRGVIKNEKDYIFFIGEGLYLSDGAFKSIIYDALKGAHFREWAPYSKIRRKS